MPKKLSEAELACLEAKRIIDGFICTFNPNLVVSYCNVWYLKPLPRDGYSKKGKLTLDHLIVWTVRITHRITLEGFNLDLEDHGFAPDVINPEDLEYLVLTIARRMGWDKPKSKVLPRKSKPK